MTDIVLRMKALPDLTNEQAWAVVTEGAQEIERLREANEELIRGMTEMTERFTAAMAPYLPTEKA